MRWLVIIVALALSAPGFVQPSSAFPTPDGQSLGLAPVGTVSDCGHFNPGTPIHAVTVLAVGIRDTGDVATAAVKVPSGNPALDAAAIACAKHMYIPPPMSDGRFVAVTWIVVVGWWPDGNATYFVPRLIVNKSDCDYPWLLEDARIGGVVGMSLHIGPDGRVQSATITKSSGMQHLDDASSRCALAWQYPPVLIDGRPAAVDIERELSWATLSSDELSSIIRRN